MTLARLTTTGVVALLLMLRDEFLKADLRTVAAVALAVTLVSLVAIAKGSALGVWSAGFWYLVVLALFHLGLAIPVGFGYEVDGDFGLYIDTWFDLLSYRAEAVYLSTLAVAAATVAYLWLHRVTDPPEARVRETSIEGPLGAGLTIAGATIVLGYVAATDPAALLGVSRGTYWNTIAATGIDAIGAFVVTFGGILLAAAAPSRVRNIGLLVLAIFGTWALAVGARTLIMYTLLAMLITVARLREMPRARVAAAALVGGLAVVSLVGIVRNDGLGNTEISASALNPVNGVIEMGGSIRPLIENVTYARSYNEDSSNGATYIGWAGRAWETLLGEPQQSDLTDPRLAGNEFRTRIDGGFQIGYSAVAEAFRNWRTPGVVLVFALFGALLGLLDGWRLGSTLPAVYAGVLFYALAYHVRQPSIQLVPILVTGAVLVALCKVLERRSARAAEPGQRREVHERLYQ